MGKFPDTGGFKKSNLATACVLVAASESSPSTCPATYRSPLTVIQSVHVMFWHHRFAHLARSTWTGTSCPLTSIRIKIPFEFAGVKIVFCVRSDSARFCMSARVSLSAAVL